MTQPTNLQTAQHTDYSGIDELWNVEKNLKKYNSSVVRQLSNVSSQKIEVLEFGAGIGTLATLWQNQNQCKPECLEIDKKLQEILSQRGFTTHASIEALSKKYDTIYTSNVLEHIEDDVAALRKIYDLLCEDGYLSIYVPAFTCLYSGLDKSVGHYRRYERNELIQKVNTAGFKIEKCHYSDSLGFFVSLLLKVFGNKNGSPLSNARSLRFYDKYIYPISELADWFGARFLFGKNLLIIAKKKS